MSRRLFALFALAFGAVIAVTPTVSAAAATTITEPAHVPYAVTLDSSNRPQAFTVVAKGFRPGSLVYVEQCDGHAPTDANWRAAANCDLGSSPAAAIVDKNGTATFDASDKNHAFHPFLGESPQQLFNCVPKGITAPKDDLPTYSTCQVRVSSNNYSSTTDQVFFALTLPTALASAKSSHSSSSNRAAVVAVIVAAALLLGGGWFFLTRRRATVPRS